MAHAITHSFVRSPWHSLAVAARTRAAEIGRRTRAVAAFFDLRMERLIAGWIGLMMLAGLAKVLTAPLPVRSVPELGAQLLPYLFVALSPVLGYRVAAGSFPRGLLSAQPLFRIARLGRWRPLDIVAAQGNPAYGPAGFLASLLVGILLNVPVRTLEYLAAMPSVGVNAPGWAQTLHLAMTMDVIVMNFFYMVCFVMALRSVPLFPRMLLFAWTVDVGMQFMIADMVAGARGLPPQVGHGLLNLLHGNLDKVFISAAVWLPYLLVSERVNVTFRHRCRQD